MASFFNISRFGRQANKPSSQQAGKQETQNVPTDTSSSPALHAPAIPQLPRSPSLSSANPAEPSSTLDTQSPAMSMRKPPFFLREEHSGLLVKGNFNTLAAKPPHVDLGEWLAHQVVEQYRVLEGLIKIVQEVDAKTGLPICNPTTCPTMHAAESTYTWLDNNRMPQRIPAAQYMARILKWCEGRILDPKLFPVDTSFTSVNAPYYAARSTSSSAASGTSTPIGAPPTTLNLPLDALAGRDWLGKASGFPESFEKEVKGIYKQMCRCYAHLYYAHWLDPFYHLSAYRELNTCFIHFVNVGKRFNTLHEKDLKPLQPLVDIWMQKGHLTSESQQIATSAVDNGPPSAA